MSSRDLSRRQFLHRTALGVTGAITVGGAGSLLASATQGPATRPSQDGRLITLEAATIAVEWNLGGGGLRLSRIVERAGGATLLDRPHGAFSILLGDRSVLDAARMKVVSGPRFEDLAANPQASRASERRNGRAVVVELRDADERVHVVWRAMVRDGARYLRQSVALQALKGDLPVREICLLDLPVEGATVNGVVAGSPVVAGRWFFGLEHPLSRSTAGGGRARCSLERELPLRPGTQATASAVIGLTDEGQLRRGFLEYVERERAHPYRTFLHYNSWYDLGYFTRFDEAGALGVIEAFGRELHEKRGVTLDSFLFDDGWDDRRFWGFHDGLPNGFLPLRDAAARYGSAPGVWLSPWGGYGDPRKERLKYGGEHGFETNEHGFALSGPVYFQRFREVCLDMIRRYGVNQFKIDGTGSAARVTPGSEFGSDFEAAIRLIDDLRAERPDLYVNLTTGTYPSPFWLRYADSIWRGGYDHEFTGVGTDRQRWITYRDADTFRGVVQRGPLFPLSSLMLHGLILAKSARGLDSDPAGDFPSEIRSYFGSGTQLQEMYVTHSLLRKHDWDVLAESAKWSRANAGTLADVHWFGGDPARLEVYGWASWSPAKGILTLRNPSDRVQTVEIDPAAAFELPGDAPERYRMRSPWAANAGQEPFPMQAGKTYRMPLQPFEVRTLEAEPSAS